MPLFRPFFQRVLELRRASQIPRHVLNLGHRGASGDAPENTLAAFELALRQGADGVEFDIRLARDGVPVVIHDARLERTTSGAGLVRASSVAVLKRLDAGSWFNRRYPSKAQRHFAGQRVPTLAEVLDWVRERGCRAYVEIKAEDGADRGVEESVLRAVHRAGAARQVTLISFDLAVLRRLHALEPQIALGASFSRPMLALRRAQSVRARCLTLYWAFASQGLIRRAHNAGLEVVVWTPNRPGAMRRKIFEGVDGIMTNYPGRLREVLGRRR